MNLLALRPPRDNNAGWEDLFLPGTLQYSLVILSSFFGSIALTNWRHIVIKCMTLIPVIQGSVHRRVSFASGCVMNRTCTGLLQERITCVGRCFPLFKSFLNLNIVTNRETHPCSALCSDQGICQIDTAPQSIQATFTGRHETFQYTKVIHSCTVTCRPSAYFLFG